MNRNYDIHSLNFNNLTTINRLVIICGECAKSIPIDLSIDLARKQLHTSFILTEFFVAPLLFGNYWIVI